MQLRHLKTIQEPSGGIQKVTAMTWSPNNKRLAVVTTDRTVFLYDEAGERRDKFATKGSDGKSKSYVIRDMAFSPDSTKLAIAQSDNIVFVYKLGLEWGDKKAIVGKLVQTSSVTCLTWPAQRQNELVFGCLDGQVKLGNLRSNKHSKLYALDAAPISAASNPEGTGFVTGHLDGSILRFMFDDGNSGPSQTKLVVHGSVPYTLGWGHSVCAAGNDQQVTFYDSKDGRMLQTFDYSTDETEKEFTSCVFNPSGESCLVGSFNRYRVFSYSFRRNQWDEDGVKNIDNFYTVSAMAWKPDGSRVVVGSLCGAVEMYDSCIRRYQYRGKFEFTFISLSQVIVKRLATGARIVLKSLYGYEIIKVNIYHDQYIVGLSTDTLLVGDLESCKLSEVPWPGGGNEKFYFQNAQACLVYLQGELSIVEYARNEILGSFRTEHMNPHLLSVRINERKYDTDNKKIAYLIDLQTICIYDLHHTTTLSTIDHDSRIDWLELNTAGTILLFRDKRRQLHLYDIATSTRSTLLNYCSYVQWVPDSDVVVAQSRHNLKVWYSINAPERVTNFNIKGEVQDIERVDGRTVVLVDEGVQTVHIALDETLIQFGSAIEMQDFERAVDILEQLELTPETEAMWQSLSVLAIQDRRLKIAERCYAALGDASKTRFLRKVNKIAKQNAIEGSATQGTDHFRVTARMQMLNKQFRAAETTLLDKDHVEETMDYYQELHRWDDVLRIARLKQHPDLDKMVKSYLEWLMESGQEEKAAQLKEQEGDYIEAVRLYLKGGLPARAAALVNANTGVNYQSDLLNRIADSLIRSGVFEKAGDFYERNLGMLDKAMESYKKGHAYRRAVDLARHSFPQEVVALEEEWGDWLVQQKQVDAAINHFIEAGKYLKAIEAAISANQWAKAVQIVETQDPEVAQGFYKRIAAHYESTKTYEAAEKYYAKAGMHKEIVEMLTKAGKWEHAHKKAMSYMSKEEVEALYKSQARRLEESSQYRDAEKLLVLIKQPDAAIAMYKRNRQYDDMIRLVEQYHREFVPQTHIKLAQQFENEGNFKKAEHHFVEGKDWGSATNMYRNQGMWPDAMRVAKLHGGQGASNQVAYTWAVSLGGEAGTQLLRKYGLVKEAVTYAIENYDFKYALELAGAELKSMLPEVHLKHAMYLEDEGHFADAEAAFIAAGKPKESIDMFLHQRDWSSAERVAQMHDPNSMPDVYVARGNAALEDGDHQEAEGWYLRAQKPELAVKLYKDAGKWQEAIRVTKEYLPNKLREINAEYAIHLQQAGEGGKADLMAPGKALEEAREHSRAIDAYLAVTSQVTQDHDQLEEIWETAVKLAMNHVSARAHEVVSEVSKRLLEIKRLEPAAEIWEGIEQYKNAIDIYLRARMWDKAKALAASKMPDYMPEVQRQQVDHLKENKDTDALLDIGNTNSALDLYAQQGEWEKCLELAAEQGPNVALRYATMYSRSLLEQEKYVEAVRVFGRHGAPPDLNNTAIYTKLSKFLVGTSTVETAEANAIPELAAMMHSVMSGLEGNNDPRVKELSKWRLIAHLTAVRAKCASTVPEVAAKVAVSLVRYIHDIPADKAFFEAGTASKDVNQTSMSFVFLNRYLDLSEAMDEGETTVTLENADFENTDIPYDFPIPTKQFVSDEKREQIRDWLLAVSMDQQIEQELPLQTCDFCRTDIYSGALSCYSCQSKYEPCIITGFPVRKASYIACKGCGSAANREDYNAYVLQHKACPWCGTPANPAW